MNAIKQWMRLSTTEEQEELARLAHTSRAYLYHLSANADRPYAREPQPKLAIALEEATTILYARTKGRLPKVYRTDLVSSCRNCAFAQRCLGPAAVRSDFPIESDDPRN